MSEKIVKINNIEISKTGFTNLQFETSKSSNSLNSIRGFGSIFKDENLNVIQTISMEFNLKADELRNLALIYSMFKACGILPIENEYLLKKISGSYNFTKNLKDQKKDFGFEGDIKYLVCLLERMTIRSLEKTSNGYAVNLILTLYNVALTEPEYQDYITTLQLDKTYIDFKQLCNQEINTQINKLMNTKESGVNIDFYNVETLNHLYKEHLLNSAFANSKLNKDSELENERKANSMYEENNSIASSRKQLGRHINIDNKHIIQIEMITHNKISNIPIIGSPIFTKSYLGVGESFFNVKIILSEDENDLANSLKEISDKNIINHKIELQHPLVQMFDFHSANIVNIVFNNLEQANGIMINIIFSLNGFRYSEEETINVDEAFDQFTYESDQVKERIGASYLEYLLNYLYNHKNHLSRASIHSLFSEVIDSMVTDAEGTNVNYDQSSMLAHKYLFGDLLSSYSSFPSSYGIHSKIHSHISISSIFSSCKKDILNVLSNKSIKKMKKVSNITADVFFLNHLERSIDLTSCSDRDFDFNRSFYSGKRYYVILDNFSIVSVMGNKEYKNILLKLLYDGEYYSNKSRQAILNYIREITIEMFNSKQNSNNNTLLASVIKKIYEEYYFRIFYTINKNSNNNLSIADDINKCDTLLSSDGTLNFQNIYKKIAEYSEILYNNFIKSLNDGYFIERITREAMHENYTNVEILDTNLENKIKEILKEVKKFKKEFMNNFEVNKTALINRTYNIFLTKYIYLISMYSFDYNEDNDKKVSLQQVLRSFIISSSLNIITLIKTQERTDHFDNQIVIGLKNIGYKISVYNNALEKTDKTKPYFFELFNEQNNNFHYKDLIQKEDFEISKQSLFDKTVQKDINFFYGKNVKVTFNNLLHYLKVVVNEAPSKVAIKKFYNEEREKFLSDSQLSFETYNMDKKPYSYNKLDVKKINPPLLKGGRVPTFFYKLFYKNDRLMNDRMKQRVIGNFDPFKNLESLTDTVFDFNNYVIPDFDIMISKKYNLENYTSGDEMSSDLYKKINGKLYFLLKNVASINIVKNPKNKIKTARVVLNNVSKNIFNFNPFNGSFDIKNLKNGKIDIIHVEVGDEIRIRLGYGNNIQLFNGFISQMISQSNQLYLECSSFTSVLYSEPISSVSFDSDDATIAGTFRDIKLAFESFKFSLEEIPKEKNQLIRDVFNSSNLNSYLFYDFSNEPKNRNVPFNEAERASIYSSFIISLQTLPLKLLKYFMPHSVSDITDSKLSTESYLKRSLKTVFGSIELPNEAIGATHRLLTNINNVDVDYDTYGLAYFGANDKEFKSEHELENTPYYTESHEYKEAVDLTYSKNPSNDIDLVELSDGTQLGLTNFPVVFSDCKITSLFKENRTRKDGTIYFHHGLDFVTKNDDRIFSVAPGTIVRMNKFSSTSTGVGIWIKHTIEGSNRTFISAYFHLASIDESLKLNDKVRGGQAIGVIGNTGRSSGKHLHFEMYFEDFVSSLTNEEKYINPFWKEALPTKTPEEMNKIIDWNQVNILADNGQYSESLKENYRKSKKMREHFSK